MSDTNNAQLSSDPVQWQSPALFPAMPAVDEWRVLEKTQFETIGLDALLTRIQRKPGATQWNGVQEYPPVAFVIPPGHDRMVPAAEQIELQAGILARDEGTLRDNRYAQGFVFYGLIALSLLLLISKASFLPFLLMVYGVSAGGSHIEAWLALRKLKSHPAQYLTEASAKIRYAFWMTSSDKQQKLSHHGALAFAWLLIGGVQIVVSAKSCVANTTVLAAGLIKPLVISEPWRLLTGPMLHGSIWHFVMNALSILSLGAFFERNVHRSLLVPVWLLGALGGSLLSWLLLSTASIGASGGVMAVFGFLLVMAWKRRSQLPPDFLQGLLRSLLYMVLIGVMAWAIIDNAAHAGGLLVGALLGLWAFRQPHGSLPLPDSRTIQVIGIGADVFFLGLVIFTGLKLIAAQ